MTQPLAAIRRWYKAFMVLQERERRKLLTEIFKVSGLMALVMKPRNGLRWTTEDRAEIRKRLRQLQKLGFYITVLIAPGGFILLPTLAWWLDRRKTKRLNKDQ